jgi:F0F1-type ATP synthase assembly protein I
MTVSSGSSDANKTDNPKNKNMAWWQPAMLMFLRLSVWIVAPVLLATLLGKYLDNRFDSEPLALLVCVGTAFVFSMVMIVMEAVREYKKIENRNSKKQAPNNK